MITLPAEALRDVHVARAIITANTRDTFRIILHDTGSLIRARWAASYVHQALWRQFWELPVISTPKGHRTHV